uniref:Integron gene cassette protein n=1 Tax=Panagrellus redivivus TaxID=6233 RepID=A0A7E4W5F1_PANRE
MPSLSEGRRQASFVEPNSSAHRSGQPEGNPFSLKRLAERRDYASRALSRQSAPPQTAAVHLTLNDR